MAALITALDNHTPLQIGENGHSQYGWSHNVQERIGQLHMQITRTDSKTIEELGNIFDGIIQDLQNQYNLGILYMLQAKKK